MDWSRAPGGRELAAERREVRRRHVGWMEAAALGFSERAGCLVASARERACLYERVRSGGDDPDCPPPGVWLPPGAAGRVWWREHVREREDPAVRFTRQRMQAVFDRLALALWEHAEQGAAETERLLAQARSWAEGDEPWDGAGRPRWDDERGPSFVVGVGRFAVPDGVRRTEVGATVVALLNALLAPGLFTGAQRLPRTLLEKLDEARETCGRLACEHSGEPLGDLHALAESWCFRAGHILLDCSEELHEMTTPWTQHIEDYTRTGVWLLGDA